MPDSSENRMNIYFPAGVKEKLGLRAKSRGKSPSAYIKELMDDEIAQEETQNKKQ